MNPGKEIEIKKILSEVSRIDHMMDKYFFPMKQFLQLLVYQEELLNLIENYEKD